MDIAIEDVADTDDLTNAYYQEGAELGRAQTEARETERLQRRFVLAGTAVERGWYWMTERLGPLWPATINPHVLDLSSSCKCVFGQTGAHIVQAHDFKAVLDSETEARVQSGDSQAYYDGWSLIVEADKYGHSDEGSEVARWLVQTNLVCSVDEARELGFTTPNGGRDYYDFEVLTYAWRVRLEAWQEGFTDEDGELDFPVLP